MGSDICLLGEFRAQCGVQKAWPAIKEVRVVVPTRTERTKTMYCGTCDRRRFIKTFGEGIIAVIEFEGATNKQTFGLVQEDEVFRNWTCARCKHEIGNDFMMRALDEKLEQWRAKKDLCTVTGNFQRV